MCQSGTISGIAPVHVDLGHSYTPAIAGRTPGNRDCSELTAIKIWSAREAWKMKFQVRSSLFGSARGNERDRDARCLARRVRSNHNAARPDGVDAAHARWMRPRSRILVDVALQRFVIGCLWPCLMA
jgi:hypothetical protein